MKLMIMIIMKWGFLLLTIVMESLKIQMEMIICWYLNMLKMVIYIIIYQKILKKLLGNKKFIKYIIFSILKGKRPRVTDDTPEFYVKLMKKCWDHDPENRPTAKEIVDCLYEYNFNVSTEKRETIKLAEIERQKIINSVKFQSDTNN